MDVLNSPLETGLRVLFVLVEADPMAIDINRLVLLDHGLLHSADLGGPSSLHPALPSRSSEMGMKRGLLEQGVEVLIRAGLADRVHDDGGIQFRATDRARGFSELLQTRYATGLRERAAWIVSQLLPASEVSLRDHMQAVLGSWSEEFISLEAQQW